MIKQAVFQDAQIFCPAKGPQMGGLKRKVQQKCDSADASGFAQAVGAI